MINWLYTLSRRRTLNPSPVRLKVKQVQKSDIFGDLVRVHSTYRPGIDAGEIFCVRTSAKSILAVARNSLSNERGTMALDDALRKRLGVKDGEMVDVTFCEVNWFGKLLWAWQASNPVNRIAAQLATLSILLGGIGLVLGIISLCNSR